MAPHRFTIFSYFGNDRVVIEFVHYHLNSSTASETAMPTAVSSSRSHPSDVPPLCTSVVLSVFVKLWLINTRADVVSGVSTAIMLDAAIDALDSVNVIVVLVVACALEVLAGVRTRASVASDAELTISRLATVVTASKASFLSLSGNLSRRC